MSVDFSEALSKPVESAERPKPLPMGTYLFGVFGQPKFDESTRKKTKYVEFTVKPMSPDEDVDQELLAQFPKWQEKEMRLTFYLTDDAIFRLREFLEHCGVSVEGRTFGQAIPEAINTQFKGSVIHEVSQKDPEAVYANIASTAPA